MCVCVCVDVCVCVCIRVDVEAHPVEHISPPLHGDALEHGEHGKEDVVKVGDASVRTLPAFAAICVVADAETPVSRKCTRCGVVIHIQL